MAFLLKSYSVHVDGFAPARYAAASPGKARVIAWRDYQSYNDVPFKRFMQMSRVTRLHDDPEGFGKPITVSGEPAYFVGNRGQYVGFVRPHQDLIMLSHPLDVEGAP